MGAVILAFISCVVFVASVFLALFADYLLPCPRRKPTMPHYDLTPTVALPDVALAFIALSGYLRGSNLDAGCTIKACGIILAYGGQVTESFAAWIVAMYPLQ